MKDDKFVKLRMKRIQKISDEISERFVGRYFKPTIDYRDQPHGGRSKKSRKGEVMVVAHVFIDRDRMYISPVGYSCCIDFNDVEFIGGTNG